MIEWLKHFGKKYDSTTIRLYSYGYQFSSEYYERASGIYFNWIPTGRIKYKREYRKNKLSDVYVWIEVEYLVPYSTIYTKLFKKDKFIEKRTEWVYEIDLTTEKTYRTEEEIYECEESK